MGREETNVMETIEDAVGGLSDEEVTEVLGFARSLLVESGDTSVIPD